MPSDVYELIEAAQQISQLWGARVPSSEWCEGRNITPHEEVKRDCAIYLLRMAVTLCLLSPAHPSDALSAIGMRQYHLPSASRTRPVLSER